MPISLEPEHIPEKNIQSFGQAMEASRNLISSFSLKKQTPIAQEDVGQQPTIKNLYEGKSKPG